ncbi:MAG: helix-turn-helix domain-containing protein [Leucobacter sp.]
MQVTQVGVLRHAVFGLVSVAEIVVANGATIAPTATFSPRPASGDSGTTSQPRLRLYALRHGSLRAAAGESLDLSSQQAVLTLTDGYRLQALSECTLLVIDAPIELAQQVIGRQFDQSFLLLDDESQLLRPTIAFADQLPGRDRFERPSSLSSYYIERLLQEMLLALIVDGMSANRGRSVARAPLDPFKLALSVIQIRSNDPEMTTDVIAEEVHLSRRQLERLFQKHGTSVAAEVRRSRVMQAASMLRDPQYSALSVDQLAQFVGFSGGSSLARAMSSEGMDSPSKLRAGVRGEPSPMAALRTG